MEDSAAALPNTEEEFTEKIEGYFFTRILSADEFLGFLKVHLLSVSDAAAAGADAAAGDADASHKIRIIKVISSWGNHATAVCFVKNGILEGCVRACLQFKSLPGRDDVITRRYDSPQGVVQLVFPKLVEKVREIMVLGNVPLDVENWTNWDNTILTSVLHELNINGIVAGRDALEHKLTLSFERIRKLTLEGDTTKSNELREIRIKYCNLLMDLLRDDLLKRYDGNVQQGLLGTINFGNKNDEYNTHNGKPVTDLALGQAAYNVLFLVHIQIGGRIYTVHMDIDRPRVEAFLKSLNDERKKFVENEFQSVSYWVGGVLEFIHTNKAAFVECVSAALGAFSGRTPGVGAAEAAVYRDFVLGKLRGDGPGGADVPLQHDAFILSCKSVTLIHGSGPPATPVPVNDNTVGTDHDGRPFSSFKETDFAGRKITGVSFDVYCDDDLLRIGGNERCCHFPNYELRPIDRIIRTEVGVFDDSQTRAEYSGTTPESQEIQDEVIKSYRDDLFKFRAAEVAEARKGEAEARKGEAERAEASGAGPAITLADALKTAVKASSPQEETAAKASLLGLLKNPTFVAKKVVGYICDSYNFWSNPLRRAGSSLLHDKGLDIQLLDLVAYALSDDGGMDERITSIITEIRASDHFPAFEPINHGIIMLFAAGGAGGAGGAGDGMNGGGRSRRRSLQKKTRRISSIRQRTLKKKNISRKYSSIRSRRCYSRKNGR